METAAATAAPEYPSYLSQAWLVLVLALAFGASLAGVQMALSGRIAQNKLDETLSQVPNLVPGADSGRASVVDGRDVYRALAGDTLVGWVIPASGQGFADRIELLIGIDATLQQITGLYVLDQKETPGLGNFIVEDGWRAQFAGKSTDAPITVTKAAASGQAIKALTGATISSQSVCDIVNRTLAAIKPALAQSSAREE